MRRRNQNGFILPTTVILLFVCSLALAAVLGYAAFTTRMTDVHLGNSICRLAAQLAIEAVKQDIYKTFYNYSGGSSVRIGTMTGTAFDWFNYHTANSIGKSGSTVTIPVTTNINGCVVTPRIHSSTRPSGTTTGIVTLRATATRINVTGTT